MREPRNPFRLRASEHIESDETFVRLFSPDVLDMLPDNLWDKHQIIRSAPGGGKTSLCRLFTPKSLLTVHALRTRDYTKDIFQRLKKLDAISDDKPLVLGIFLSCSYSYASLDDLNIDSTKKQRLLLALLNARITLAALNGALTLKEHSYPDDLGKLSIRLQDDIPLDLGLASPCNGQELYDWARHLEKTVCDALDSFAPLEDFNLQGHETLFSLNFINPDSFSYDGMPITKHILIMLDDVHHLTKNQRRFLLDSIIASRLPVSIWIAERLEALDVDEMLSLGASQGRDYGSVVTIEDYWRGPASKKFEKTISNVADRRASDAKDAEIGSFAGCLQDSLDGAEFQEEFHKGAETVAKRAREQAERQQRYSEWVSERDNLSGTPREIAIAWRTLEILIERDKRKAQQGFDFKLGVDELEHRDDSAVRAAAEFFFCKEFNMPYYFGLSRLATMASSNIEQFLWLAGDIFEESVSAALLKQTLSLSPKRQETILKKTIKEMWISLPQKVKYGNGVKKFLESIGKFAQWETNKPNAPYAPGVTGIAISMADRDILRNPDKTGKDPDLAQLARILTSCIAYNLLEVTLNQKCKGQYWMVLNLNRMLCVHFDLPMQYGGWREKTLKELIIWLKKDFVPSKKEQLFS
ncbi:MAG: hypothetical protein M1147_11185 [Nitrospirae bacterium]|nr:hypothetical protein [Nitrospirota bacterium]MCL5978653.1 hypothetical protein [Nitrospirota bacterium]